MEQIKIEIKTLTPSNNKLIRMHFRNYKKFKDRLAWELFAELVDHDDQIPKATNPEDYRKVKLNSYRVSLLDEDNFNGGLKPLIDCMKELKVIYDDSPKYFSYEAEQVKVSKKSDQKTEIIFFLTQPDTASS